MAASRFLQLPPELQTAAINFLLRPGHLAQVCLVSKQLQRIALPLLYRDFSINVSEWTDAQLERFVARGHAGHRHIRSLDIDSEDIEGEEEALKVAKDVLQVLPRNILRSFRCPLEEGIDNDIMILLAGQQRSLQSICIGPLQENALNLIDALRPWPPQIETIIVPWRLLSMQDHQFYHELIERSRKRLKALTIRTNDFAWIKTAYQEHDKAHAQACEDLARGLFDHTGESEYDRPPLEMWDINFQNQELSAFDSTWRHYVDFTKLRTVQIWNCHRTDTMLRSLIDLFKSQRPRLEGIVLSFEESRDGPALTEELLRSISGLRYLNMCYVPAEMPALPQPVFDVRCLTSHTDTLQDVYLGVKEGHRAPTFGSFAMSVEKIHWLTERCRNLRQLAIAMPHLEIQDALAGRWGQSIEVLRSIATLPRLKVLRSLTWPVDCHERWRPPHHYLIRWREHRAQYMKNLDIVADSIARLFAGWRGNHQDRLSVVTFGNAERRDHAMTLKHGPMRMSKPATYKIRRIESEFGMLLETVRLDPAEMQYEEPIAFVFDEDTDQGLSLESYPWGDA